MLEKIFLRAIDRISCIHSHLQHIDASRKEQSWYFFISCKFGVDRQPGLVTWTWNWLWPEYQLNSSRVTLQLDVMCQFIKKILTWLVRQDQVLKTLLANGVKKYTNTHTNIHSENFEFNQPVNGVNYFFFFFFLLRTALGLLSLFP